MEPDLQLFLRPEHDQWDFVRERRSAFDAVIVPARYLAPYPPGHPSFDKPADRLAQGARDADRPLVTDPDTAGLWSRGALRYGGSVARLRETAVAATVDLPLTAAQLRDTGRLRAFVDACAESQAEAWAVAAPYADFRNVRDERFALNIQMLERVAKSVGTQVPVGFMQATVTRLMSGELLEAAPRVARTGVRIVFVRVRGLDAERASAEELEAYADVIDSLIAEDVQAVPDCVGRLGPFLMAGGAFGFSGGTHHFRRVAKPLLAAGGGGGGEPLTVELAAGGEVGRDAVGGSSGGASLGLEPDPDLDDIRERRLSIWRDHGQLAATSPQQFLEFMRVEGDAFAQAWAATLLRRMQRAA